MLNPDGSGTDQFQGIDVNLLEFHDSSFRSGSDRRSRRNQSRCITLSQRFDNRGFREERTLAGKNTLDPGTQQGPFILVKVKLPPQIQKGPLPHLLADSL